MVRDIYSYVVGRVIGWGYGFRSKGHTYYNFNVSDLLVEEHKKFLDIFCNYSVNKRYKNYTTYYAGSLEKKFDVDRNSVEAGIIIGQLERFITSCKNKFYPFINEAKPNLLHINYLGRELVDIVMSIFENAWITKNTTGNIIAVLDVSGGLEILEDEPYFKLVKSLADDVRKKQN